MLVVLITENHETHTVKPQGWWYILYNRLESYIKKLQNIYDSKLFLKKKKSCKFYKLPSKNDWLPCQP